MGDRQTGLQLRLTWRGARALLGVPAGELAGDTVDLAALLGRRTGALLDRLAAAPDWAQRFDLLDAELQALAADGRAERGVRPEVGYAWDRLYRNGGNLRIGELAAEVGWSRRHLASRFQAETGLTPKAAARVIRFERACDRLRGPDRPALAAVAADAGYVDQAHLARDFRDLAGSTATAWLRECLPAPETGSPSPRQPRQRGVEELRPDAPAATARGSSVACMSRPSTRHISCSPTLTGSRSAATSPRAAASAQHPGHQLPPLPVARPLHVAQLRAGCSPPPRRPSTPGTRPPARRPAAAPRAASRAASAARRGQPRTWPAIRAADRRVRVLYRGHEQGLLVRRSSA